MRLFEFTAKFNNIHELVKHYKERFPEEIKNGNINGNCGLCAAHFEDFAADNGFGMVERVQGYFTLDKPDYENFTNKEIKQMSQAGSKYMQEWRKKNPDYHKEYYQAKKRAALEPLIKEAGRLFAIECKRLR